MTSQFTRWLPTGTPAILAGALTSGIVYGLHALGIIATPQDVAEVVTPLAGFLVAAVVQKPTLTEVESEAKAVEDSTLGKLVAKQIETRIDAEPKIVQEVLKAAIGALNAPIVNAPPVIPPVVAVSIAKAIAEGTPLVEAAPTFLTAPSTEAPHISE